MTDLNSLKPTEKFCLKKNEALQQHSVTSLILYYGIEYILTCILDTTFLILEGYQHYW